MDIFSALEAGATLVTANSRLSRDLRTQFHARQREAGRRRWNAPDVLPLTGFLERLWSEWLYSPAGGSAPLLLSPAQERAVWEDIIGAPPDEYPLLDIPGTAQRASEAWKTAHDYDLPVRGGDFQATEDGAAFLRWAREYETTCRDNRWLDRATLPGVLLKRIAAGDLAIPTHILYAGFDELAPLETSLFRALAAERVPAPRHTPRRREMLVYPDARHEMAAAAGWARRMLEQGTGLRIGVIVPDLQAQRQAAERAFQRALDERPFASSSAAFHVSLGPPLAQYPVVHAALAVLEAAASLGALRLPLAGSLLRSPFLGGAQREAASRAALDARLRKRDLFETSIEELLGIAQSCPSLRSHLKALAAETAGLPDRQSISAWAAAFARLLQASGWPGEGTAGSVEYQVAEAWREFLGQFASLGLTLGPVDYGEALSRLRRLAAETTFQPEDPGAPIQVMGVLEAGGLEFDQLWILGLHDGAFPAPPRPNPFLPLELQRRHGVPHSTPGSELAAARRLLERLTSSASELVLSYPERDGEQELRPTTLLERLWRKASSPRPPQLPAPLEELIDNRAKPLPAGVMQRGGAGVLKQMSACPFRAFAEFRLGTRELDDAEMGISALARGSAVHKALESFWRETQTHRALCALSGEELAARIAACVQEALRNLENNFIHHLERERLQTLLGEWLEIEKERPPFTVVITEGKVEKEIAGLKLEVRVDRVDELLDGRHIVLDYKTGIVDKKAWIGERMREPQLPFYCTIHEAAPAGVVFAQVRAGSSGFTGLLQEASLPVLTAAASDGDSLSAQIPLWRHHLADLATRFREGDAEVDPQKGACKFCALAGLCRVHEAGGDEEEDDG